MSTLFPLLRTTELDSLQQATQCLVVFLQMMVYIWFALLLNLSNASAAILS